MDRIRVVIADDSALARGLLRSILESEEGIEIVAEASNGRQAVERVRELKPDLLTIDLDMPVMGGLEAIEEIMATRAVPILVVSGVADAQHALEAVRRGALDTVAKPEYSPEAAAEFVAKVRMLAKVPVITHLRARKPAAGAAAPEAAAPVKAETAVPAAPAFRHVVAIASSTGGPQALAQFLSQLPAGFPCPVLISQHISDGFAAGMADWLATLCKLPVRLAGDGEPILPGTVYISPSEQSLAVAPSRRLTLLPRGAADIYHPSCDALLESVGAVFGNKAIGIILTGMGHDGAAGLAAIRAAGGTTLAQDEATSVIFGMNRIAIERGAASSVLPLEEIAAAVLRLTAQDSFVRMSSSWT